MKITKVFLIIIMLFLLPSCAYSTVHKRDYVETIYIDYEDDKIKLNIFTANVQDYAKNDEDGEADVLSISGSSIIEAIKLLEHKIENNLDFHHTRTIILQENFFENSENMKQLIDTFYEYNAISRKCNIYTTTESFDSIEDILKKDVYLEKLAFPNTVFDILYNLGNYKYFLINNISLEDESIISKKGDLFIDYNYVSNTLADKSFGYYLLTGSDFEDIVLDTDFVVKKYKISDKITSKYNNIYYDVNIDIEGDYIQKNFDKESTEKFVYSKITDSFDYFTNLYYGVFNIEEEIYKSDYKLYKDFIEDKSSFKIIPRFKVTVKNTEI